MSFLGLRSLAFFLLAAFVAACPAIAQATGDAKPDQQKAEPKTEAAHIAEAAKAIPGPAGFPECVHTGELTITLWMKNDMDTASRHLAVYDRFGCPTAHLRASFRCLLRFGMPNQKDKVTVEDRVRDCWITPEMTAPTPAPAAPAAAAAPPPAAPGTAAH